jgi:hypothetical protein
MMRISLLLIGILLLSESANAQYVDASFHVADYVPDSNKPLASQSMILAAEFLDQIDSNNSASFGFATAPNLSPVHAGAPLPVAVVGLDSLSSGLSATRNACRQFSYASVPLVQGNHVGPAILVTGPPLISLAFGYAPQTQRASYLLDSLVATGRMNRKAAFLVNMVALNLLFLGMRGVQTGEVYLTPLYDYSDYGLRTGIVYPLSQMWTFNLTPANVGNLDPNALR